MQERIQKIIAAAGLASRREAEEWISAGKVLVNGDVAVLGTKADPAKDKIVVDNKPLSKAEKKVYYLFNKPMHVMVTRHDPEDRPTIYDYLKKIPEKVNYVGRLDFDSEGLILLTNDGDLQARLTHPRHEIPKTYHARVTGFLSEPKLDQMRKGMRLKDYTTQPCEARVIKKNPHNCWVEIILREGKNRQVRNMIEAIGHTVLRLKRVAIGSLQLGDLKTGHFRSLTSQELKTLGAFK